MFASRSNVSLVAAGIFGAALALTTAQALSACNSSNQSSQDPAPKSKVESKEEKEDEEEGDEEEQVDIAKVPDPVRASAQKHFADLKSCKASRENDHGSQIYEIVGKGAEGMAVSLNITESGAIFEVERETKPDSLPAEVRATLAKNYAGAAVKKAEVIEEHFYEVQMTKDGKAFELQLSATGHVKEGKD
jgi:hypothetical protein